MKYQHFAPQISYSQLQGDINKNYHDLAQEYYKQREAMFIKTCEGFVSSELEKQKEVFINDLKNKASAAWDKQNLMYAILKGGGGKGLQVGENAWSLTTQKINALLKKDSSISKDTGDILKTIAKRFNNPKRVPIRALLAQIGTYYEQEILKPVFEGYMEQTAVALNENEIIRVLGKAINTGKMASKSNITSGTLDIRADWIFTEGISYKGQVLIDNRTELPLELQINLDNAGIDRLIANNSLEEYINQCTTFGFSVKSFNLEGSVNGRVFSSSSVLADHLNNIYSHNRPESKSHTWQPTYATTYAMYELSHQLISIISPIQVAIVGGNSAMWMSDFLSANKFYMNVHMHSILDYIRHNSEVSDTVEGHPKIKDYNIYIRKINDIRSLSKYSISNIAQGNMGNDYTIKPALVTYRGARIDELLRMT